MVFKYLTILAFTSALIFSQNELKLKKDRVQVTEDESIKIDVLKNDGIKDKSNLEIRIEKQAQKGVAVLSGNMIEYTPNGNESGSDSFTYSVDIGTGVGAAEVSIKIKSVNDEPVGLSLSKNTIKENNNVEISDGSVDMYDEDELADKELMEELTNDVLGAGNLSLMESSPVRQFSSSEGESFISISSDEMDLDLNNRNSPIFDGCSELLYDENDDFVNTSYTLIC